MPTVYDIDTEQQVADLLPVDKRYDENIALLKAVFKPIQWVIDLWLDRYRNGDNSAEYDAGTTYAQYDRVQYGKQIWESLADSNTGNTPVSGSAWWMLVQENFIGLNERLAYTGQTLVLTYALNRWFGTTFVQPPNVGDSDIYISNNTIAPAVFISGASESNSSLVYSNTSSEYVINDYAFTNIYNFTIHIPTAVYNALDTVPANREKILRAFADKYVAAGMLYTIQTY